jgi:hypothetical protein
MSKYESGLRIDNQKFSYELDISAAGSLRAVGITNKITGDHFEFGRRDELRLWIDTAISRIEIKNWKRVNTGPSDTDPDEDPGFKSGYFRCDVDDKQWERFIIPLGSRDRYTWARTSFSLPDSTGSLPDSTGQPVTIVLGGYGLYDSDWMRVFLNGTEILLRVETAHWREPAVLRLDPEDAYYGLLRFGGDNVLAIQMKGYRAETAKLQKANGLAPCNEMKIGACTPILFDQYVTVGEPSEAIDFVVCSHETQNRDESAELAIELEARGKPIHATIRYAWEEDSSTLRRFTSIMNSGSPSICLLDAELGDYQTNGAASEGFVGFPVHVNSQLFFGLAHPAGLCQGLDGRVRLTQFSGKTLSPGDTVDLMEVVVGIAGEGQSPAAFRDHIKGRCRRVARKHDKPYALFEGCGTWDTEEEGSILSEEYVLEILDGIAKMGERHTLCFDALTLEAWLDTAGDLTSFYKNGTDCSYLIEDCNIIEPGDYFESGWPDGPGRVFDRIRNAGAQVGLWFDSSLRKWSIGRNPAVASCGIAPERGFISKAINQTGTGQFDGENILCRASEPYKSLFGQGISTHIRDNGVWLFKLDNLFKNCWNENHGHRIGKYSIEAICSSVIENLQAWDKENPDCLLIGYWGYRSPWWLLWVDTIYESGLFIEAGQPCGWETKYKRDSVTRALDQSEWYACHAGDVPSLCKDSLGIWLASTTWNSNVGKERWQEGFVMDLCRGSLLSQLWGHPKWLTDEDVRDLATFTALLRKYPECFRNSRFILGNPWKDNLYGYLCSSADRAFIALNNGGPSDAEAELKLSAEWGLPQDNEWQIFQRWPRSEKYFPSDGEEVASGTVSLRMEPWDIVLLEVVPDLPPPARFF